MSPDLRAARPKLLLALLALCACWACARTSASQKPAPERPTAGAESVAGYRGWTRVNPEPAVFHSRIATQCALPAAGQARPGHAENPHRDKFVTVYVNEAGRRAMLEEKAPRFPAGTVIVKEKLATRDAAAPELLTAMLKREAGYDPGGGDWEYMVLDGAGRGVRARGRLESCRACHQAEAGTDFVSRNYLPRDIYRKLK